MLVLLCTDMARNHYPHLDLTAVVLFALKRGQS
jgi:general stress protein CsbA